MTWEVVVEILSWVFILSGSAFTVIGAVGTLRFPDFWSRLHAASVSESAGMILLVVGLCLQAVDVLIVVKLIIIGVFIIITGPTSTHAVANAALTSGAKPDCDEGSQEQDKVKS